jgi:hypothetical protein
MLEEAEEEVLLPVLKITDKFPSAPAAVSASKETGSSAGGEGAGLGLGSHYHSHPLQAKKQRKHCQHLL